MLRRRWGDSKARKNLEKHGVSFDEAYTVFNDPLAATLPDHPHSSDEDRFTIIGRSDPGRLIVVTTSFSTTISHGSFMLGKHGLQKGSGS